MSVPPALLSLAQKPRFWTDFFWDTEPDYDWQDDEASPYPQLKHCHIELYVSRQYRLTLALDEDLSYFSLQLRHSGNKKPVEIAWDDQAHWHPHVLKWEELDLIGRWMALNDSQLPHPGLPLVLLHRFAPLCEGDDVEIVHPLLEAAYRSLGVFKNRQIENYLHKFDRREAGFNWQCGPRQRWYLQQNEDAPEASAVELYTLRHSRARSFPFAAWDGLIQEVHQKCKKVVKREWLTSNGRAAEHVAKSVATEGDVTGLLVLADTLEEGGCDNRTIVDSLRDRRFPVRGSWVVEVLLDLEPGTVIKKVCGSAKRKQRVTYRFEIMIPSRTRRYHLPDETLRRIVDQLDGALSEAGLGKAEVSGMMERESANGVLLEESVFVSANAANDRDRAVRIIQEILRQNEAPARTRIEQQTPTRQNVPYTRAQRE
jgi:hypothetical protein